MRDDDAGAAGEEPGKRPVHQALRGGIELRGGLVQDHHVRIAQEKAGASQDLRLAGREATAAGAEHGAEARRQLLQPRSHAQRLEQIDEALVRHAVVEKGQIVPNAGVEKLDLLCHQADAGANRGDGNRSQIDSA